MIDREITVINTGYKTFQASSLASSYISCLIRVSQSCQVNLSTSQEEFALLHEIIALSAYLSINTQSSYLRFPFFSWLSIAVGKNEFVLITLEKPRLSHPPQPPTEI